MTRALAATLFAALVLIPAAGTHGIKEGGTFRIVGWSVEAIDPAFDPFVLEGAACGKLMGYPDKRIPEGLRLRPELAEAEPVVSRDGKTYTFTIRKEARFSDGKPLTARAFVHALERILTPAMESFLSGKFSDLVGAQKMLDGKATTLAGAVAKGRTLTLRLTRRVPDFLVRTTALCAVPPTLPVDPEGVQAPIHSAAPYFGSQYVPGERLVLERNRFYKGNRVHHVDRFVATIVADPRPFVEDVANGTLESVGLRASDIAGVVKELAQRYGVNRPGGQFFIERGTFLRMFVLNTSRPLFKNNPKLRQALNFAVDRRRLTLELGARIGTATDQYLAPVTPGFRDERIYPLKGPNLKKARALAKGHMRDRKVVLYTPNLVGRVAGGQILKENLEALGLEVRPRHAPASAPLREDRHARHAVRHRGRGLRLGRSALRPQHPLRRSHHRPAWLLQHFVLRLIEIQPAARGGVAPHRSGALPGLRRARPHALARRCACDPLRDPQQLGVRLRPRRVRRHEPVARPDRGVPQVRKALAATLFAALVLIPAAGTHGIKEGGTFRIAESGVNAIDPAFVGRGLLGGPACSTLMGYPDKPVPEGLRLRPELADAGPVVSRDGKTYTFTIRKDARFSDGKRVTARAFTHALERILTPAMETGGGGFSDIVGAKKMLAGKAATLDGAVAKGRTLTLRLIRRAPNFLLRLTGLCAVPPNLPVDPEGAGAPLHSAAPYYAAEYVPGERLVLERNRFYKGNRVHHVDRFVATLTADPRPFVDDVANGTLESVGLRASDIAGLAAELIQRYGRNRPGGQFFIQPGLALRMFVLNTSRPLFKNNPKLRQAVNFAVDRRRLTLELGPVSAAPPTSTSCPPCQASATSASTRSRLLTCRRQSSSRGVTCAGKGGALHAQLAGPSRGGPDPQGEPRGAGARGRPRDAAGWRPLHRNRQPERAVRHR